MQLGAHLSRTPHLGGKHRREEHSVTAFQDGPSSRRFRALSIKGNVRIADLASASVSEEMASAVEHAPAGKCVSWGVPVDIGDVLLLADKPESVDVESVEAEWIIFMHTSDLRPREPNADGFLSPMRGQGQLNEHAANYVVRYTDGSEGRLPIRRRHQLGAFTRRWGENCFQAVAHQKQRPVRAHHEQTTLNWGRSQTRATAADGGSWVNWLWAWENPHPDKAIAGFRFEPVSGTIVISGIAVGSASAQPLRWEPRRKVCLTLPPGEPFLPDLDERGLLQQVQLDMGQVISATPRQLYPNDNWDQTDNNAVPKVSENQLLIEYAAHPDAAFHLSDGQVIPISILESSSETSPQECQ